MESKLLSSLGKIAGIAGIGFGIFLFLFQGVLEQRILPDAGLTGNQGFTVIMTLMVMTFGIAGIGLIAWLVSRSETTISASSLIALVLLIVGILAAVIFIATRFEATATAERQQPNKEAQLQNSTGPTPNPPLTQDPGRTTTKAFPVPSPPPTTGTTQSNVSTSPPLSPTTTLPSQRAPSIDELVAAIASSTDRSEKNRLKTQARSAIAEQFRFSRISAKDFEKGSRKTDIVSFVKYDPDDNVLTLNRQYSWTMNRYSSSWETVESIDAEVKIYLGRLNKLVDYEDGDFSVDCNGSGPVRCVQYQVKEEQCSKNTSCVSSNDWHFEFSPGDNAAGLKKLRGALVAVMYKIDGRPPK